MSTTAMNPEPIDTATVQQMRLEAVGKACASWFLWVAGLSMANSVLAASGAELHFLFGLGITSIVDAVAHQAGTCRMGADPATSVVNAEGRAHELDNLYVVDTSVFPSIGAVNPALTAMANSLRVGDHLRDRLH